MDQPHLRPNGVNVSDLQEEFIEWLLDPEKKGSQNDWARANNISPSTLSNWKRSDRIFKDAWERRAAELNIDPERIQAIVNALFQKAKDGDVKAMELYLRFTEKYTPKVDLGKPAETSLSEMSDAELQEAMQMEWASRQHKRSA